MPPPLLNLAKGPCIGRHPMTVRTIKRTVTFMRPFTLDCFDRELPAGPYIVETDEELLEGISFPVYRRIATLIHLHSHAGLTQTLNRPPC